MTAAAGTLSGMLNPSTVALLKLAGPTFTIGMQLSNIKTAMQILKVNSVGSLSPLPFLSLTTNGAAWTLYGLLRDDPTLIIPNLLGFFAGMGCALAYYQILTKEKSENRRVKMNNTLYAISTSLLMTLLLVYRSGNEKMLGAIGCVLSVVLMAAPLSTLQIVLREKCTAALPFSISFTGWCNALSWTLYGLLITQDPMVT